MLPTMIQSKNTISLLIFFAFGISGLWAQPTLTNAYFPDIGELVTSSVSSDSNAVSEGAAGANISWNFSSLLPAPGSSFTTNFQTPTGTPYEPFFPTSNICGVNFVPEAIYGYYQKTSTEFNYLGLATMDFSIVYNNPQTLMRAPLSFNGSFTDVFWGSIDASGFLFNIYGESESKYDAYGTLILPIGTYNNAIRVKSVTENRDTADFGGLLNISNTTTTSYEWYAASLPGPLASIAYTEGISISLVPGFPPMEEEIPLSKSISFITDFLSGVVEAPQLNGIDMAFRGANPVADVLALDMVSATAGETLQLQVYSRNGQLVSTQNITSNGATLSIDVNVTDCSPGMYFVSITDGNARLSKGFVKI